jgi:hypothetical protein
LQDSLGSEPLETLCLEIEENLIIEDLIYQRRAAATLDTTKVLFQALKSSKISITTLDTGLCSIPLNSFEETPDFDELKDTLSSIEEMAISLTLSAFYDDQGKLLSKFMCEIIEEASDDETEDVNDENSDDDQDDGTDSNQGERPDPLRARLSKPKTLTTHADNSFRPHVHVLAKFFEMACNLKVLDLHWYDLRPRNPDNIPDSDEQQFFRWSREALAGLPLKQCTLRGIYTKEEDLEIFIWNTHTRMIMREEVYLISGGWTTISLRLCRPKNRFIEICINDVQCIEDRSRKLVWFKSRECELGASKACAPRSHIYFLGGLPWDLEYITTYFGDMPEDKQLLWMYRRCAQFGISRDCR